MQNSDIYRGADAGSKTPPANLEMPSLWGTELHRHLEMAFDWTIYFADNLYCILIRIVYRSFRLPCLLRSLCHSHSFGNFSLRLGIVLPLRDRLRRDFSYP